MGILFLVVILQQVFRKMHWLVSSFGILIGSLFVVLSATPLPLIAYGMFIVCFAIGYLAVRNHRIVPIWKRILILSYVGLLCAGMIVWESMYWRAPSIPINDIERIFVVGDSISSGMGGPEEQTWPKLLAQKTGVPVINLAIAGSTSESANRKQIPQINNGSNMAIIEIGGNDILNVVRPNLFRQNMTAMIQSLKPKTKRILWFELPLIPSKGEYGRIQRSLSREMGITLIPKRYLVDVLQAPDTTSDTIHLTSQGHERMAKMMAELMGERKE